jgi:iron complex transport system substrate-binding protein
MKIRCAIAALMALAAVAVPAAQTPNVPRRIVSLVPSVTEMLFDIGAGDAVVGVSSLDHYPPAVESRVKVGGLIDPDFERIISLRPDLVIVYGTQNAITDRLGRAGIPMFNFQHSGLAEVTAWMRRLGERVGRGQAADARAAAIERRIADIRAKTAGRAKPKTMIVFERERGSLRAMFGSGGTGFLHDMLAAAGGVNVFADVPRESLQITTEQVIAKAPDVVLEFRSGPEWTAQRAAEDRRSWLGLSIPAVRNGQVHILIDEMLGIPGPRIADAILAIAKVLHPGVF